MWDIGGRKGRTLLLQGHQYVMESYFSYTSFNEHTVPGRLNSMARYLNHCEKWRKLLFAEPWVLWRGRRIISTRNAWLIKLFSFHFDTFLSAWFRSNTEIVYRKRWVKILNNLVWPLCKNCMCLYCKYCTELPVRGGLEPLCMSMFMYAYKISFNIFLFSLSFYQW